MSWGGSASCIIHRPVVRPIRHPNTDDDRIKRDGDYWCDLDSQLYISKCVDETDIVNEQS